MPLPTIDNSQFPPATQLNRRRFTRREDLTADIRLQIAIIALHSMLFSSWGAITALAAEYCISRTFVYMLAAQLQEAGDFVFDETTHWRHDLSLRALSIQMMLSLRLEGQTSIGATSKIMKRFDCELSSTGSVSQILSRIGRLLPSTVSASDGVVQLLVFVSDEIFSKSRPILLTVDPCSSAILRIELTDSRTANDWREHFQCLFDNGVNAIYLVSDNGQGLIGGHADAMHDVVRQSDTYHAIAHVLGQWVNRLEDAAYKAIALEEKWEKVLNSAKSAPVQEKRLNACIKAHDVAEEACELADTFRYIYLCLIAELNVFDAKGNLRTGQEVEAGINACLDLIKELNHTKISEAVNKSRRTLPDLLHYFDIAKGIVDECKDLPISDACLKAYCLAWQWGKAIRKAKTPARRNAAKENAQFYGDLADGLHDHEDRDIQQEIFGRLDRIVQSSAMVECVNSIIRPYLNVCKNQVSQELLNLIMFYHNHRRYVDGMRKGKTPMEILTGRAQSEDWMSLLFDILQEKDPELLADS